MYSRRELFKIALEKSTFDFDRVVEGKTETAMDFLMKTFDNVIKIDAEKRSNENENIRDINVNIALKRLKNAHENPSLTQIQQLRLKSIIDTLERFVNDDLNHYEDLTPTKEDVKN